MYRLLGAPHAHSRIYCVFCISSLCFPLLFSSVVPHLSFHKAMLGMARLKLPHLYFSGRNETGSEILDGMTELRSQYSAFL